MKLCTHFAINYPFCNYGTLILNRHSNHTLQGNVKQFLRLTTTVAPVEYVLGIRRAILEVAGVPNFDRELRANGFKVDNRANFR